MLSHVFSLRRFQTWNAKSCTPSPRNSVECRTGSSTPKRAAVFPVTLETMGNVNGLTPRTLNELTTSAPEPENGRAENGRVRGESV